MLLKTKTFEATRLKLTGYYALAALLVAGTLTGGVYYLFIYTIRNNVEYKLIVLNYGTEVGEKFVSASVTHLLKIMISTDILMVIVTTILGYVFASFTLNPIRKMMTQQRQFMADAAHELRTPLAVMKTGIDTLPDIALTSAEVKQLKTDLEEELTSLITTTNDILFIHQLTETTKKTPPADNTSNLTEIVQEQIKLLTVYAQSKHINYKFSITNEVLTVPLHKENGVRIVRNLIKNALDYTPAGQSVSVTLSKKNNQAHLQVIDTGIGIEKDKLPFIFDRFYTVKDTNTLTHGSGLGLSIVEELVKNAKGTIVVESKVGAGTTFVVQLPILL